ncbi:FliI/YscN family ATPase [Pseudodesulfovibrio sp.]|uniref:FliI/YscN family ATPase n=1 Tax=Pseudodesulfovibrio sp. TaxID=2035812 RepID=UPI002606250B|nr:FliI/YscN family ATPase [Pseudodesulfovibrio sp.]MDD3312366.1 FliI/YscN family ATPase [Pseudodesulfovibrio sp.]
MADASRLGLLESLDPCQSYGKVTKVVGLIAEGRGIKAPLGSVCYLLPDDKRSIPAEVVGFRDGACLFMPYSDMRGIGPGSLIRNAATPPHMPVGQAMLGRAVDAFGEPLDGKGAFVPDTFAPLHREPPNPLERPRINEPLDVGIRSVNALLTLGKGQRVGIMAGSGVGKSTTLGMMARYTKADINVIALVGERGREVVEFMERDLGPAGMARSVLVVATSDKSPLIRMRAAYAATAVAEHFRDQGKDVLLMMDSVTRFAMAGREVGLAAGEPPTRGGYTPSVFAHLPQLLERAGKSRKGSITGIYTVLVDGDDFTEPIADSTRSILDGHIVLTRELADLGHYPAIDVLRSISRLRSDITTDEAQADGRALLRSMATFKKVEDMVNIGAYQRGANPEVDKAIAMVGPINGFLRQLVKENEPLAGAFAKLHALVGDGDVQPNTPPRQAPKPQGKPQMRPQQKQPPRPAIKPKKMAVAPSDIKVKLR